MSEDEEFEITITTMQDHKGDEAGVQVFMRHRESGRYTYPFIGSQDLHILGDVIRDYKERLRKGDRADSAIMGGRRD